MDEAILVQGSTGRWGGREQDLGGVFQRAAQGDVDGDGDEEVVIATGIGRADREAPIRVWAIHADRAELLHEQRTARSQVTDLRVVDGQVFIAFFADERAVEAGWLKDGGLSSLGRAHMGMRQLPLPGDALAIGRLYGEEPRSHGDLLLRTGAGEKKLPSLRGVRSLASGDLDGDGDVELLVGDGWHSSYGTEADARVRLFEGSSFEEARTIAFLEGDYAAMELAIIGQGPQARVLVTGSSRVHLLSRDGLGWKDEVLGPVPETGNAVPFKAEGGPAVLISGSPARVLPLP